MLTLPLPAEEAGKRVLTPDAQAFISDIENEFGQRRRELLEKRRQVQKALDSSVTLDFLSETAAVRMGDWVVAPIPADLQDRRVEITGPVDRKRIINALNSGANGFMADFEDSHAPTWEGTLNGQINLADAIRRTIEFTSSEGNLYRLNSKTATLMVRPRGWHWDEKHFLVGGRPISASIFDFGLYFYHNARKLLELNTGPYFYLPKLESHLEACLWNDIFLYAQDKLSIPKGSVRATVLIETVPAAFEMDEILYELKDHSAGLNCGRWDYIFSFIKKFHAHPDFVLPDRNRVVMTQPFLNAYTALAIQTCHRRRIHCMGGMAAQIPIRNNPQANEIAMQKVREDKDREVSAGHDGTWVAHPGLVAIAKETFDSKMHGPNQIGTQRSDVRVSKSDLLRVPQGKITEEGVRINIRVGIQYLEAWLGGNGCVPLYHLMEDAATAEISRSQIWQWIHHHCALDNGTQVTPDLFRKYLHEELVTLQRERGEKASSERLSQAAKLFERLSTSPVFTDFLITEAYPYLN